MHIYSHTSKTGRSTGIFSLCGTEMAEDEFYYKNTYEANTRKTGLLCVHCSDKSNFVPIHSMTVISEDPQYTLIKLDDEESNFLLGVKLYLENGIMKMKNYDDEENFQLGR